MEHTNYIVFNERYYTGHSNGRGHVCDFSSDGCDGVNCGTCEQKYIIELAIDNDGDFETVYSETTDDHSKAKEIECKLENNAKSLIEDYSKAKETECELENNTESLIEDYERPIPAHKIDVEKYYSGHLYRRSPYETSDSCGNCDGANCDDCIMLYRVELVAELEPNEYTSIDWRTTKDFNEIEELKDELEKDAEALIKDYMS